MCDIYFAAICAHKIGEKLETEFSIVNTSNWIMIFST